MRDLRPARRLLQLALLAALLLVQAAAGAAEPAVKQVLVLQSLDRGNLVLDQFTGIFRVELDQRAGKPVNVIQVVVGPKGFVAAPDQAVVDYIRSTYAGRPAPDLVMTVGGPAAVFARKHRQQLFPAAPLLFASVDQRYLRAAPLGDGETAVSVVNNFAGVIDDILQVQPETRRVFMVIGSGTLGQFWRRELEPEFRRFQDRLNIVWSDELSLQDILRRCASLPSGSAIFYLTFGTDAQGGAYADEQVLDDFRSKANAPLFGALSSLLGHGIVGGHLMSIETLSRRTADVAIQILHGASPASLQVPPQHVGQPVFDDRELKRWGIAESRLPPGSVVQFRRPSLWEEYKLAVLAALGVLLLQSLLILRLLYEHRARQRAEVESRRNLSLAADAGRRLTMSALTTSIGHELAQPLSAVMFNAQALQKMGASNQLAPGEMDEILADIQGGVVLAKQIIDRHSAMLRGHQVQMAPTDLRSVLDESLALFTHDLREQRIDVLRDLPATPCIVEGDQVLLQQVFVNLVRNAMDALAEAPPATRRITVRVEVKAAAVEVSVADTGAGLPPAILATLFTSFVTTKSHGLGIGLTIARSIVEAHGGRIAVHGNDGGGATFTVTLPLASGARLLG